MTNEAEVNKIIQVLAPIGEWGRKEQESWWAIRRCDRDGETYVFVYALKDSKPFTNYWDMKAGEFVVIKQDSEYKTRTIQTSDPEKLLEDFAIKHFVGEI